jgi:hypothetical protein
MTVLVSAVAMGACGKKDELGIGGKDAKGDANKVLGACTYETTYEGGKVTICEQMYLSPAVAKDDFNKAQEALKDSCKGQTSSKFTDGCSKKDALGGCKSQFENGAGTSASIVYKGGAVTSTDQIKAYCANVGLEFFQP